MTRVTFVMMVAAERIPVMVPVATVAGIGKDHVFMLIITDPAAAARRLRQILRLAAQAALWTGFGGLLSWFRFRHIDLIYYYLFIGHAISDNPLSAISISAARGNSSLVMSLYF